MTTGDYSVSPEAGDRARTSRRTFLLLAGSTAGVGLSATTASAGEADGGDEAVVVAGTGQRASARAVLDSRQEDPAPGDVSLRVTEPTAATDAFAAGDSDVFVGSRPLLPAEHARTVENGVGYERREVPTATAALSHPESTWVECLSPAALVETWGRDGAVETWAEVTNGEALADTATDADRTAGSGGESAPSRDGTAIVRGVRAYQYASGYGGVGHYRPETDWLTDRPRADGDASTALVRLAFVYANSESFGRQPVADFVRAYRRRSERQIGTVPFVGGQAEPAPEA